ncbi:hypothetical protein [Mucilaginibacter flavidus]|uniref:hypothetical protein n=1 Tax=Mucilaginibacter flavidus TaxID=2949309 RepID=UPI002092DACC|nr:hypothetical protein [Mucilaginibacter flavidus]MCO5948223.1 hypothetical protein [Mucilaginibacter flavidus]
MDDQFLCGHPAKVSKPGGLLLLYAEDAVLWRQRFVYPIVEVGTINENDKPFLDFKSNGDI